MLVHHGVPICWDGRISAYIYCTSVVRRGQ
nr:MAG TPA: hypothetical protein [Caudoviricetes sp.]